MYQNGQSSSVRSIHKHASDHHSIVSPLSCYCAQTQAHLFSSSPTESNSRPIESDTRARFCWNCHGEVSSGPTRSRDTLHSRNQSSGSDMASNSNPNSNSSPTSPEPSAPELTHSSRQGIQNNRIQNGLQTLQPSGIDPQPNSDRARTSNPYSTESSQEVFPENRHPAPHATDPSNPSNYNINQQSPNTTTEFPDINTFNNPSSGLNPATSQQAENAAQATDPMDNSQMSQFQAFANRNSAFEHAFNVYMRGEADRRATIGNLDPSVTAQMSTLPYIGQPYYAHQPNYVPPPSNVNHYSRSAGRPAASSVNRHTSSGLFPATADPGLRPPYQNAPSTMISAPSRHRRRHSQTFTTETSNGNDLDLQNAGTASQASNRRRTRMRPQRVEPPYPRTSIDSSSTLSGFMMNEAEISRRNANLNHQAQLLMMQHDLESHRRYVDSLEAEKGLDVQNDGRPSPKETEELTINLECKACMSQLVDTVMLPCGHAVLCRWCAEQHMPSNRMKPRANTNCPMCRKPVKQKVRIYIS